MNTLPTLNRPNRSLAQAGTSGNILRMGHHLPRLPLVAKADRAAFDSKFVFRDISGRGKVQGKVFNPLITADYDGTTRLATNRETLYRSWEVRYWGITKSSKRSANLWPFSDEDADKPRQKGGYRLPP